MMHGGWLTAQALSTASRERFAVVVDTLIPPENGWPDAGSLRIVETAERYLVPDDEPLSLYPHWRRREFDDLLERVGTPLLGRALDSRVATLARYESTDVAEFERLRDFVYYVYYGSPTVVEEIRARTRYGAEFHGATQPAGYDVRLEGWGQRPLTRAGVFISTASVTRSRTGGGI
jgi:hypothetical protein